uniref:Uncharacterized protein n=1 Tax=Arundo donax TaxID=35708 RepID=A0A0A9HRN7_ARUDO
MKLLVLLHRPSRQEVPFRR